MLSLVELRVYWFGYGRAFNGRGVHLYEAGYVETGEKRIESDRGGGWAGGDGEYGGAGEHAAVPVEDSSQLGRFAVCEREGECHWVEGYIDVEGDQELEFLSVDEKVFKAIQSHGHWSQS